MSDEMEGYVDKFWELIDMMLSALLFVLMGTEMLVLNISGQYVAAELATEPAAHHAGRAVGGHHVRSGRVFHSGPGDSHWAAGHAATARPEPARS